MELYDVFTKDGVYVDTCFDPIVAYTYSQKIGGYFLTYVEEEVELTLEEE